MQAVEIIALTMGVAWASGINLYAAVLMLGLMGLAGHIQLPPELHVLMDPLVLLAAGFMYCVEFFADKTPGVDSGWDALHTFIRIPAGAALAAAAVGEVSMPVQLAAFLIGGGVAGATHLTKAGTRVLINTSPEPVSNIAASVTEDLVVLGGLWAALQQPELFLAALLVFFALVVWLLPKLLRGVAAVIRRVFDLFRGTRGRRPLPADRGGAAATGVAHGTARGDVASAILPAEASSIDTPSTPQVPLPGP